MFGNFVNLSAEERRPRPCLASYFGKISGVAGSCSFSVPRVLPAPYAAIPEPRRNAKLHDFDFADGLSLLQNCRYIGKITSVGDRSCQEKLASDKTRRS